MAQSPIEPDETNDSSDTQSIDHNLSSEVFETLWGNDRNALPTAVDYAYEQIWKQLVFVQEQKEQRLSDTVLAEKLGVSRTPVRQALERLAQDRLVRADPRRGFWVRTFTAQDIHEIYDLRAALEVLALRLAAPHLDPADLREHLTLLYQVRAQLDQKPISLFLQGDFRLHTLFIRASGNSRLIHYLSTLRSQFSMFQVKDTRNPMRMEPTLQDHEQILLALLEQDIEKATRLLADHIVRSKEYVLADIFTTEKATKL
jgi:DNA-binding GntR family transcriptional regulator